MYKNKKLIPLIFLTISTFFLFYTFYESEIKYRGTEHSYYFVNYSICAFLIICSIASFFLSREKFINISIIFFSSLFALYLANAFLILKEKKINFDNRTKLQIYQDLKKVDDNIALMMYPQSHGGDDEFPLYSLSSRSNKKTIHCNENGYYSIHQTDRYGFNNPDSEWEEDEIEFMLIGDSFTQGACVNEPDTISGNLKKMIDVGGVLNLGHGLNGPLREYVTLREYLPLKKINRVVWLYFESNDLPNLIYELKDRTLSNYINDRTFTQKLHLRQNEIDEKLEKIFNKFKQEELTRKHRGKIISFLRLYKLRNFIRLIFGKSADTKIPDKTLKDFSEIIHLAKILSSENGAKFYFVYLPDYFRYTYKFYQGDEFKNYGDVINIVNELNIPIIDLHKDLFEKHPKPLSLFPNKYFHYNELGYKLTARIILKKIIEYEKK